jgi:hypothetical protein
MDSVKYFTIKEGNILDAAFLTGLGIRVFKNLKNLSVTVLIYPRIFSTIPLYGIKANTQKYIIKVNKKSVKNSIGSSNLQGIPPDNNFETDIPPIPRGLPMGIPPVVGADGGICIAGDADDGADGSGAAENDICFCKDVNIYV